MLDHITEEQTQIQKKRPLVVLLQYLKAHWCVVKAKIGYGGIIECAFFVHLEVPISLH